ncbi:BON domain-containing protein [Noviherbaspirillum aerium]|uniref:BON domain-containing protein n=1 Tax=Noviherbaspirillum aerium TaxID=2588497 RepID=UPI00124DA59A|nr:BON domain-containing protein [Noviherbaspirillum aerium]
MSFRTCRFPRLRTLIAAALAGVFTISAKAEGAVLQNWFDDPFLQVSSDMPGCPQPRGPYMTEAERTSEAHSRIERGTSCWLAGACAEPNSYRYDASIAQAVGRQADKEVFNGSSIWLTVQRRFIRAEGCVTDRRQAQAIERWLGGIADVERVIVEVMQGTRDRPPYRTMEAPK